MNLRSQNSGIALLLAIVALFIISALGVSVLFLTVHEMRIARNAVVMDATTATAEEGVYAPLAEWDVGLYNQMAIGDSMPLRGTASFGGGVYLGQITRLNAGLFLVTAEGSRLPSRARQRMGLVLRLNPLQPDIKAALTAAGPTSVGPLVRVQGADVAPDGWPCPPPDTSLPGLR